MAKVVIEEVRQVVLEVPDACEDCEQMVRDAYDNGKVTARSKPVYLNYAEEDSEWRTLQLVEVPSLDVITPGGPELVPVRVVVHPNREECSDITNEEYAQDVHYRLMERDGKQHMQLMNWEPLDYSFETDSFGLQDMPV